VRILGNIVLTVLFLFIILPIVLGLLGDAWEAWRRLWKDDFR